MWYHDVWLRRNFYVLVPATATFMVVMGYEIPTNESFVDAVVALICLTAITWNVRKKPSRPLDPGFVISRPRLYLKVFLRMFAIGFAFWVGNYLHDPIRRH